MVPPPTGRRVVEVAVTPVVEAANLNLMPPSPSQSTRLSQCKRPHPSHLSPRVVPVVVPAVVPIGLAVVPVVPPHGLLPPPMTGLVVPVAPRPGRVEVDLTGLVEVAAPVEAAAVPSRPPSPNLSHLSHPPRRSHPSLPAAVAAAAATTAAAVAVLTVAVMDGLVMVTPIQARLMVPSELSVFLVLVVPCLPRR